MRDSAIELLKELTQAHGPSGSETAVRKTYERELGQSVTTDKNGSVVYATEGQSATPRVMVEAHMDEVGFMVQSITEDGYLKIVELGGWWAHTLLSQRVRILTVSSREVVGVITCKPPHFLGKKERSELVQIKDMYIDVGADSAKVVTEDLGISLGDSIVPDSAFTEMHNSNFLLSKAFDNRVGVALAIQATQILKNQEHPNTLYTVGSVQEEVGTRGAQSVVRAVNPDVAIVLEGAPADDFPGSPKSDRQSVLGKGAQIRLMDPTAIMNRPLSQFIINVAKDCSLPFQVAVRRSGGTDAKAIQLHNTGVPTTVIGVPARYIHTHNSIIHIEDYSTTLKLIVEVLKRLDSKTVASFC